MKKIAFSLFLFSSVLTAFAGANQKALEFYTFEVPATAKKLLQQNLQSGTLTPQEQAEANFYLGEIAYSEQDAEAAENYYKQGQAADPAYAFNAVGLAKIRLKTNKMAVAKEFKEILSGKNKKDMALQTAVAQAYLSAGELYDANKQIEAAKKIDAKYAPLYVVEGDIYAAKKDYKQACPLYETAIYFDAQCAPAYIKYARAFTYTNANAAVAKLKEYAAADPNSALIYREIGEIYFKNERYADAVKAYDKYKAKAPEAAEDYKYALLLFLNNEYDKSLEIVQAGLKANPDNFDLKRILMYNYYKQSNYQDGVAYADKFMTDKKNAAKIIGLDHVYYARLLAGVKERLNDAASQYEIALKLDSNRITLYKELGSTHNYLQKYEAAIGDYKTYIAKAKNQVTALDYNNLGNSYLYAVSNDSLVKADKAKKEAYCLAADSAFAVVAEKVPESYLGNLGRALIAQVLYPETEQGKAKPYFEAILPLLSKDKPSDVPTLVKCYEYLGSYYYVKREMATSKTYWENILSIVPAGDPAFAGTIEKAQKVLKTIKD